MDRSEANAAEYQYMGTYVQSPTYSRVSAPACTFRLPSPPAVAHFRLPPLRCSFPSLLHPHYALVKKLCDAWTLGFLQPHSPPARLLLLDCLLPRLLCRNIPTASSLPRLIQVTKMISWLIIADDEDDLPAALGADVTATSQKAGLVMAILRGQNRPLSSEEVNAEHGAKIGEEDHISLELLSQPSKRDNSRALQPTMGGDVHHISLESLGQPSKRDNSRALQALAQLWEEMCIDMPPNLRNRFVSTMADYFDAIKVQATYRKAHQLPDVEAYLEIRRQASFIFPAFSLVEYAIGIELDEDVYANPQVQKFRSAAVDYICLCNDILSCRVEIGVGDYFNMPSIVYGMPCSKEKCETFQDAINFVARMIEDLDARLVSMVASITQSSLPCLQCPSIKTYITALGSCMSGCLAWFLETARYCNP